MTNEAADTEETNSPPAISEVTAEMLPYVVQALGIRNLVSPPVLAEALLEFTLTGAMVTVRCQGRAPLAARRLSHFAPDMLTRLCHDLGAVGLVEIEISEPRLNTRGFAFFLESETVDAIVPKPEPEPPSELEYPEGELGKTMRATREMVDHMMRPILERMDQMQLSVNAALVKDSEHQVRGEVMADMMEQESMARMRNMLEEARKTPADRMKESIAHIQTLMGTAADARKELGKLAPPADGDAAKIEKLLDFAESPRVAAIGRGIAKMLGKDLGAAVDVAPVTPDAEHAAQLPNMFSVPMPPESA